MGLVEVQSQDQRPVMRGVARVTPLVVVRNGTEVPSAETVSA